MWTVNAHFLSIIFCNPWKMAWHMQSQRNRFVLLTGTSKTYLLFLSEDSQFRLWRRAQKRTYILSVSPLFILCLLTCLKCCYKVSPGLHCLSICSTDVYKLETDVFQTSTRYYHAIDSGSWNSCPSSGHFFSQDGVEKTETLKEWT